MATFKFTGGVSRFKDKLVSGMIRNGYSPEFAERTFGQLEGFGSYGFPESYAASFALIAYASNYVKCRYPDAFCAALLNGFDFRLTVEVAHSRFAFACSATRGIDEMPRSLSNCAVRDRLAGPPVHR